MDKYESFRENGWKSFSSDIMFTKENPAPTAKVISYFIKRKESEPAINIKSNPRQTSIEYDRVVTTSWLNDRINRTLQYKRKWYGEQDVYNWVVLVNYRDQLINGNYKKGLISSRELAMLLPNKK